MAERRNSLQPEPVVPRNNKRRRTMMDSVSEVARWLLPSWASEGSSDTPQDRYQQTTSGHHHQASGSALSNGERNPKRPRPNEVTRREPMGRLSPVASKAPSTTSTQMEPDFDDGSDSSTSGCSSLSITAPAAVETSSAADTKSNQRRNRPIQNTKESKTRDVSISVDQTSIVAETSVTASPSLNFSLFSRPSRALSSTMNASLPLAGSGASGTRSLSSSLHRPERSLNRSIFYEGKTTYGGAAAHRKLNLFSPSPYQMAAKRSKPASNVNVPESSSAAKRLIEALERMNTPVQNAKKIPLGRPENILTQNSEARRKEALESIASLRQSSAPPPLSSCRSSVQPARIGSNVKPVLSSSDCPIDIDDADSAPLSNASNVPVITQTPRTASAMSLDNYDTDRTSSAGGKMKSAKSIQHHLSRKIPVEEEPPPSAPDLPSAPLPIKDLPSFSFQTTKAPSVSVASSQDCHKTSATRSPLTSLADFSNKPFEKQQIPSPLACPTNDTSEAFTFAAPIDLDKPSKTLYCKDAFDFKDPLYLKKDSPSRPGGFTIAAPAMISGGSFTLKTKTPEPAKIAIPEVLSTGSVMDIIGKNDTRKDAPESASHASNSSRTNSWECPECRVQSPSGSCQNCASKKSSASSATGGFATSTTTTPVANSWGDLFKKSSSSWDCSVCLVNNKSEASKCLACETPKPGSDSSSKSDASATKSFGTAAASQWGDHLKSSGGESPKAAPALTGPSSPPSSTVKSPLSAMIKMAPGWNCDVCLIRNDLDKTKCVACETPKPGSAPAQASTPASAATTSAFKFGVPKSDENKNVTSEPVTPIFGVKSSSANGGSDSTSVPNGGFKFGVPQTKAAEENNTSEPTNSTSKALGSSGFSFGTPALSTAPALPQATPVSTPAIATSTTTATAASNAATSLVPTTTTASTGFGGFSAAAASWGSASASSKTEASPAAALFSFGPTSTASATSTPAASTATAPKTFTFGATSNATATPTAQPSAATFSFGATTSASTVPATTSAPTATFAFGGFGATPAKTPATGGLFGPGAAATSSVFGANTTVTTATTALPTSSTAFSFSSPASTGTAATPSVSATATVQATPNPMFTFGNPSAAPSATETQNSGSPFVFGTSSSSTGRLSGFSFGATAPTATTTAATSAPTFTFGAATAPAAATPLSTVTNGQNVFGSNSTPGFGVSNTNSTAPPPATNNVFQFNANLTPAGPGSSTPFTFSAGGTSAAAVPSSGGLFSFGANTTNTTAPSSAANPTVVPGAAAPFQFGAAATAAAQTPAATPAPGGMFNFGGAATATPAANFQFGGPSPGQGAAPFQFGNPAPALGGPALSFPPTNADNPFDATLTQGRRMRRAVRRRGAR